jgi:hypothetical protein
MDRPTSPRHRLGWILWPLLAPLNALGWFFCRSLGYAAGSPSLFWGIATWLTGLAAAGCFLAGWLIFLGREDPEDA